MAVKYVSRNFAILPVINGTADETNGEAYSVKYSRIVV